MSRYMEGGPVWQRWDTQDHDDLSAAERQARREEHEAFLERQLELGQSLARARGPRRHDTEWQAGISHRDEFGPGRD